MNHLAEAADAVVIDIEVAIDEVEGLEDIADAAAAVKVECAIEHNVFSAERLGGGDEADHAIGDGDAEVVSGVDGVGADCPGGKGVGDLGGSDQIQGNKRKKQKSGNE